ncbi:hypothetical protein [Flavobacterium sp.]|uniref:hypothetical protein n=1 Tax=Flavobacterium sp. TaxID=239 RepID=UPI00262BEC82|nr:hypothetical protein [Flavobacterium sp.]
MLQRLINNINNKKSLKSLLDDKNTALWQQLIKTENIKIVKGSFEAYGVFSKNNKHVIYTTGEFDPPSFTHELLHIYLSQQNVHIHGALTLQTYCDEDLRKIFSRDLLEHISNNLNHAKMIPLFLDLGYNIEDFISDYYLNKGESEGLDLMIEYFCFEQNGKRIYLAKAIDCYIGVYIAARFCPNKNFNYSTLYNKLEQLDKELLMILNSFVENWNNYDYSDSLQSYQDIATSFVISMSNWCRYKMIVEKVY